MNRAAVFLDRDGVVIENVDTYVRSWADVRFLPGALKGLRRLATSSYTVVMVSNQSAVGRGLLTAKDAHDLNARVIAEVAAEGGRIHAAYLCLHAPADACLCRKPAPGLLLQAQAELRLDLADSYLIGDAVSDIQAAHAAGARGILVQTGRGKVQETLLGARDRARTAIVRDLAAAVDQILLGVADR